MVIAEKSDIKESDEMDVYGEEAAESMMDDDELSPEEEGFMRGWNEAG